MNRIKFPLLWLLLLVPLAGWKSVTAASAFPWRTVEQILAEARMPSGFELELLSPDLDQPRMLSFADNGELLIGSGSGRVYRLQPPYRKAEVLLTLDGYPHSVVPRSGELLIARTDGIYRLPYRPGQAKLDPGKPELLARLPSGGGHDSRTIGIGPDGLLYVSLGITGNCSDEYLDLSYPFSARRGGVFVVDETQTPPVLRPFAAGLRNPVGFDWHPVTGALYASNNGPDHLGYELPPEYFSRLTAGSFHGLPWFSFDGQRLSRDHCIDRDPPRPLEGVTPPEATFPARNAPMGLAFVPPGAFSPAYQGDAIVALHGSWGTRPSGGAWGDPASRRPPKLVRVRFSDRHAVAVEDLLSGFQNADGDRWARPVGLAFGPDGALYFTSDSGVNGLFRLRWRGRNVE